MVKILLPTMAAFKGDVETMFGLLERTVGRRHQIGLEIIGKLEHFQNEESLGKMKDNLCAVAKGAHLVVHGFSGLAVYENGVGDMRNENGVRLLENYLRVGEDVGAKYVHVHSGAGYKGTISERARQEGLDKVKHNLVECGRKTSIPIGIENLPDPLMGDIEKDPEKMWLDCVESIEDCLHVVSGTSVGVTLDTCHYACNRKGEIDLVEPVEQLGGYFSYLHVSDVSGFYVPNQSLWQEGFTAGDGQIGKESFKNFFRYIREKHPEIGLCVEVNNRDFKNPAESEESLKRVLAWLG